MYWLMAVFTFVILPAVVLFCLYTRRYANPYKLVMVFGKKGSGKTLLLCKLAYKFLKNHKQALLYTNCVLTLPDDMMQRVRDFDPIELGRKLVPPPGSAVFVDEVGMIWDNRHYKDFRDYQRDFFKLQRQYKVYVYLFSQTFDIDVKLRNLCDRMYMCKCHANVFCVARRINRVLVVVEPDGSNESRIADNLRFEPLVFQLFGSQALYFTYVPFWVKRFDTAYMARRNQVGGEGAPPPAGA